MEKRVIVIAVKFRWVFIFDQRIRFVIWGCMINENYRTINGKLVGSHVIGCHTRCLRRWQSSCHCWRCMFWGQWSVLFSWKNHWSVLCSTSTTYSSVNQCSKPWLCEILRDTFRDGCVWEQVGSTDLIFLFTLQVCKFLNVTSASPTPWRENPSTV